MNAGDSGLAARWGLRFNWQASPMKYYLALAALVFFSANVMTEQRIGEMTLWQGLLCKAPDTLRLTKTEETTNIPYTTQGKDPLFGYGFVLQRRDGVEFTVRSHVTFPVADGSKEKPKEVDVPDKRSAHGVHQTVYTIDDGDPPGVYQGAGLCG